MPLTKEIEVMHALGVHPWVYAMWNASVERDKRWHLSYTRRSNGYRARVCPICGRIEDVHYTDPNQNNWKFSYSQMDYWAQEVRTNAENYFANNRY